MLIGLGFDQPVSRSGPDRPAALPPGRRPQPGKAGLGVLPGRRGADGVARGPGGRRRDRLAAARRERAAAAAARLGGAACRWDMRPPTPGRRSRPAIPAAAVTDSLQWLGLRIDQSGRRPRCATPGHRHRPAAVQRARRPDRADGPRRGPRVEHRRPVPGLPAAEPAAVPPPRAALALRRPRGTGRRRQPGELAGLDAGGRPAATAGDFYLADPVTGEIVFGNYDDQAGGQADGLAAVGHGSIPPAGSQVRAARYRYVSAGAAGNVAPAQVTVLGVPVPGITNVSNLGPGLDGADEEPIEDTLRRAPEELKIRDRAVTADDYEFLAREASNDVRIVRCLTPRLQAAVAPGPAPAAWQKGDPWTFAGIVRAPGNVESDRRARSGRIRLPAGAHPGPYPRGQRLPGAPPGTHGAPAGPRAEVPPGDCQRRPGAVAGGTPGGCGSGEGGGRHAEPDPGFPAPDPGRPGRHRLAGRAVRC